MNESFDLKGYITTGTFSVATSFNHDFRSKFETKIKHCSNVQNLKPHLNLYIFVEKCAKKNVNIHGNTVCKAKTECV